MPNAKKSPSLFRLTLIATALTVLIGAIIIVSDRNQLEQVAGKAEWRFLIIALGISALSYLLESASMVVMFRAFGIELEGPYLLKLSFVSSVLTNLIALPAALGLQLLVLKQRGVTQGQTVGSSILLSYFKNLVFYALIPLSMIYIIFTYPLILGGVVSMIFISIVLAAAIAIATILVFHKRIRTFIFKILGSIWHFVTRRNIEKSLNDLDHAISRGITRLRHQRTTSSWLAASVIGNVALMIVTLWFCFKALGITVHLGALITGFNFGITLTVISFIPGDLGVQEASIAGILAIFGVAFTQGILVAILFRALYYFVPFIFSLGFYWSILKEARESQKEKTSTG